MVKHYVGLNATKAKMLDLDRLGFNLQVRSPAPRGIAAARGLEAAGRGWWMCGGPVGGRVQGVGAAFARVRACVCLCVCVCVSP